jgi:hypothetical protein
VWHTKFPKKKSFDKATLASVLSDPEVMAVAKNPAFLTSGAVDHLFYFLDTDNSGTLSPKELVLGLSTLINGTTEQKAEGKCYFDSFSAAHWKTVQT